MKRSQIEAAIAAETPLAYSPHVSRDEGPNGSQPLLGAKRVVAQESGVEREYWVASGIWGSTNRRHDGVRIRYEDGKTEVVPGSSLPYAWEEQERRRTVAAERQREKEGAKERATRAAIAIGGTPREVRYGSGTYKVEVSVEQAERLAAAMALEAR